MVNNSGRSQRALALDTELKVDQELFDLNVIGSISLTKVVLPHMVEKKAGHVIVVSSVQGKFGMLGPSKIAIAFIDTKLHLYIDYSHQSIGIYYDDCVL